MPGVEEKISVFGKSVVDRWRLWGDQGWERRMARDLAAKTSPKAGIAPVVFFNATTRLYGLSLNGAYALLTAWSLRLQGIPVSQFVCRRGLTPCVLGTNRDQVNTDPPCARCIAQSEALFEGADVNWLVPIEDPGLVNQLGALDLDGLMNFSKEDVPLGKLVLPAVRWALRRYSLKDDADTLWLYRRYISSAWNVAAQFGTMIKKVKPQAVVVFNGTFYPEATARWIAQQNGIRVISHETAFLPFSGFFTTGESTAYPIEIPEGYRLSDGQNQRLDTYLGQRFKGNFTMGGIRFWPEMTGLDPALLEKIAQFRHLVPVFTNVVFDTSQGHANVVFPDMFSWLDLILEKARSEYDTLFIIRAHPDEGRPGKSSRETVREWVEKSGADQLPNLCFIDAGEYVSSYELVQRAKFVLAYNSSIGLEAAVLGATVLCGGKVKYNLSSYPTVFQPETIPAFTQKLNEFLAAEKLSAPAEFQRNARLFIYFQVFRSSLIYEDFLETAAYPGLVRLKKFPWHSLLPENSETLRVVSAGILNGTSFYAEDPVEIYPSQPE